MTAEGEEADAERKADGTAPQKQIGDLFYTSVGLALYSDIGAI